MLRVLSLFLPTIAAFHLAPRVVTPARASPQMVDHEKVGKAFTGDGASIAKDSDLVFACLDKNGDGVISKDEMCTHLVKAGYSKDDAESWFAESAEGGTISKEALRFAFVTYPELRTAPGLGSEYDGVIPEAIRMDATNFIFEADTSRDGEITSTELETQMAKLGFASESIKHVFDQIDMDSDGMLDRDELAKVFLKYSALRLALRKD